MKSPWKTRRSVECSGWVRLACEFSRYEGHLGQRETTTLFAFRFLLSDPSNTWAFPTAAGASRERGGSCKLVGSIHSFADVRVELSLQRKHKSYPRLHIAQ
jgi:hypothetical protein